MDGVEADADSDRVLLCATIPSRAAVLLAKAVAITFSAAAEFMDVSGPTVGAVPPGVRVAAASALAASTVTVRLRWSCLRNSIWSLEAWSWLSSLMLVRAFWKDFRIGRAGLKPRYSTPL